MSQNTKQNLRKIYDDLTDIYQDMPYEYKDEHKLLKIVESLRLIVEGDNK